MKLTLILILFLNVIAINADELSLKVMANSYVTDTDKYQRGTSGGIQLSYTPAKTFYMFLSYDSTQVCPMGCGYKYEMYGVGFGDKVRLTKTISLFGQIAYMQIENDIGDKNREFSEAIYYYLNDRFKDGTGAGQQGFEAFSVHNNNTFAGTIGLELTHYRSDNMSITSALSYRLMKIKEEIHGYQSLSSFERNGGNWEIGISRDYSSINFELGINYYF